MCTYETNCCYGWGCVVSGVCSVLFIQGTEDEALMTYPQILALCKDLDLVPVVCSEQQLRSLFKDVNEADS